MIETPQKMQDSLTLILLIGIFIATTLVLIGGTLYLFAHGNDNMQTELLQSDAYQLTIRQILHDAYALKPLGIIELGLLLLVATQVLRVALLTWFYFQIHDYWFTGFSIFILSVLIYSLI